MIRNEEYYSQWNELRQLVAKKLFDDPELIDDRSRMQLHDEVQVF